MIKLELSQQMIQVIADALGNSPYRVAAPVLNEMQKQINEQQAPAPMPEKAPKELVRPAK